MCFETDLPYKYLNILTSNDLIDDEVIILELSTSIKLWPSLRIDLNMQENVCVYTLKSINPDFLLQAPPSQDITE